MTRRFAIAAAALAVILLGLRLWVSAHEWFVDDDFYFLHFLQSDRWSWGEVFLPSQRHASGAYHPIGAYRPVGLESYYFFNFQLFGWNALGYYAVGALIHAATALVVMRIGRQLGFELRIASGAALLVLASSPGFTATYMVASHNYLLAALFAALSVSWCLQHLREPKPRWQLLSCAALLLGLLSNDFCAMLPLVVLAASIREHGLAVQRDVLLRHLRAVWPHALVTALFLDFRIDGVPLRQDAWFYDVDFGLDMFSNTYGNLTYVAGGAWQLAVLVLALVGAAVWLLRAQPELDASWRAHAGRNLGFCLVWLGVVLFPFAVLPFPHPRFALAAQAPFVLALGAALDALFALQRTPRWLPSSVLLLVVAAIPWSAVHEHVTHPDGAPYKASFALLRKQFAAATAPVEHVEICYGGAGLADAATFTEFRNAFSGDLVDAAAPQWTIENTSRKRDGAADPPLCERCRRFYLLPNRQLALTPPAPGG
ncbi:MAG TPA: hypothetical protein VF331_04790 [Polyangiales bacterium]